MPTGTVMLVITTDMACHQPLHHFVKLAGLFWLYEQVEVVWHQAPCEQPHRKLFTCRLHKINECSVITVFMKNLLPAVTAIDKVVIGVVG